MRYLLSISFFLFFGLEALADPNCPSCVQNQRAGVLRSVRAVTSEIGTNACFLVGGANSCEQESGGLTCAEVEAADASSFRADYDYRLTGPTGVGRCNADNAANFLENLHLADMAQLTADSLDCSLPVLEAFENSPNSEMVQGLKRRAWEAFQAIRADLVTLTDRRNNWTQRGEVNRGLARPIGEGMGPRLMSLGGMERIEEAQRINDVELPQINAAIATLIAQLPFGTEAGVREAVERMARNPNMSFGNFASGYSGPVIKMGRDFRQFRSELESTRDGKRWLATSSPNVTLVRDRLTASPLFMQLIQAKPNLPQKLKDVMQCRQSAIETGCRRISNGILVVSVASAVATGGLSLSGVALTGAARVALIAADLAIVGLDSVQLGNAIYDSCYNGTSVQATGAACTPQTALNAVIQKTTTAQCATNAIAAAVPGILSAGSLAVRAVRRADTPGPAAGAADNAAPAARTADNSASASAASETVGEPIVVTGGLNRQQRRILEAGRRERAARAAREARSPGAATPAPARTVSVIPVDAATLDSMMSTSIQRKRSLDNFLARYMNKNGAQDETLDILHDRFNRSEADFEEFVNTRVAPADRNSVREMRRRLVEERRQLAAEQTEADFAANRRDGATATDANCASLNGLWDNPPFETSARCRKVTFSQRTTRYCSCGKASGIGRWLTPCAETRAQYLMADQFSDATALPVHSALQMCRRVALPAGTECIHGGLGPTMAGYGGGAQMICQAAMESSVSSRLPGAGVNFNSANPPPIEVIRVAVMHNDPTVTDILFRVRTCLERNSNRCPAAEMTSIRNEYAAHVREFPRTTTAEQGQLIDQYFQYAEGRLALSPRGAFVTPDP